MSASSPTLSLRPTGLALLFTGVLFMIGAWVAAYFRRFPLSTDPREQLTLIANDRAGWTAQAIIFPVCFLLVTVIFGWIATRLPVARPRWLAIAATVASGTALLLWLPISVNRLNLAAQAVALLRSNDPVIQVPMLINANTFWLYTISALAGIALMGAALALAGALPTLGWVVTALAVAAALIGALVWHDWPPFMSYILVLVLAIGLMRADVSRL